MTRIIENDSRANFAKDLQRGEEGEEAVLSWLRSLSSVSEVIDCRKIYEWQQKDIDFSVVLKPRSGFSFPVTKTWEVKTDTYPDINGTLSYEIVSNFQRGTIGCALKTQADYIGFYCPQSRRLLYWKSQQLRDWVAQKSTDFELIKVFNYHKGGPEPQVTLCLKVPVEQALASCGGKAVVIDEVDEEIEAFEGLTWDIEKDIDY